MTIARRTIVDHETPGFYHCTNRCVRRTFLCGIDELTGKDFSHRKDWIESRMIELCDIFAVNLFAYAVMSNHYHIVLYIELLAPQSWSDEEIAERWLNVYPGILDNPQFSKQRELKKQAIMGDQDKLKKYRKRLGSLSWFMGRLNEPLAKRSNEEDFCSGRFWQGRYSSQALLDEAAVLSCMAYVDLNPVRAKIAETLEQSDNTSIKKRISQVQETEPTIVEATLAQNVAAVTDALQQKLLPISLKNYIELVEWTGQSIVHPSKAKLPANIASSL